jgi:hypothetical protein
LVTVSSLTPLVFASFVSAPLVVVSFVVGLDSFDKSERRIWLISLHHSEHIVRTHYAGL